MGNINGIYTMLQMTIIVLNDMNIIIHKKVDISVSYHNLCYFHRTAFYRFDMILSFSGGKPWAVCGAHALPVIHVYSMAKA